jgi:hypothetical protein
MNQVESSVVTSSIMCYLSIPLFLLVQFYKSHVLTYCADDRLQMPKCFVITFIQSLVNINIFKKTLICNH